MHTIKKTALLILDGWGIGNNEQIPPSESNNNSGKYGIT